MAAVLFEIPPSTSAIALAGSVAFGLWLGLGWRKLAWRLRGSPRGVKQTRTWDGSARRLASPPKFDAADQLRIVERAVFKPRRLLNRGEQRLFALLERVCAEHAPDWRVMAQVSMGEILASDNAEAYRAVNSKRVDMLLIDANGMPMHAVEMQGTGHHIGPAATRDAVKREALRRAGVGMLEVQVGDTPADVRKQVVKCYAQRQRGAA